VSFAREAHEVDVFASFFQVLHPVKVRRGSEDKLWWVPLQMQCSRDFQCREISLHGQSVEEKICHW
jgi:hypothetical protein